MSKKMFVYSGCGIMSHIHTNERSPKIVTDKDMEDALKEVNDIMLGKTEKITKSNGEPYIISFSELERCAKKVFLGQQGKKVVLLKKMKR